VREKNLLLEDFKAGCAKRKEKNQKENCMILFFVSLQHRHFSCEGRTGRSSRGEKAHNSK